MRSPPTLNTYQVAAGQRRYRAAPELYDKNIMSEKSLEDIEDIYRDRWLSVFIAHYSFIATISGLFLSFADRISEYLARPLALISFLSILLILLMFGSMKWFYNFMGFVPPKFKTNDQKREYYSSKDKQIIRGKTIRVFCERTIHFILVAQVVIFAYSRL